MEFQDLFPSRNDFYEWLEERDAWFTCENGDYIGWRGIVNIMKQFDSESGLNNIDLKDIETVTDCLYDVFNHSDNQMQDGTARYLSGVFGGFLHAEAKKKWDWLNRYSNVALRRDNDENRF